MKLAAAPALDPKRTIRGLRASERLGTYLDGQGRQREIVARPGAGGSTLVIDRLAPRGSDERLLAHLAADEPAANARIVSQMYLADRRRVRCRPLRAADLRRAPSAADELASSGPPLPRAGVAGAVLADRRGRLYSLGRFPFGACALELRWQRHACGCAGAEVVRLRAVVAALESYEPVRSVTAAALARARRDPEVSVVTLGGELKRLLASPIVLNRGLREAVLAATQRDGLTLSEIAIRCGRVKRDPNGRESGETSWLARRIGVLADSGRSAPTPWVHTSVLALIARRGLGVSPREVEVL